MGRRPRIDPAGIVAASLAIADQRGLAAVTMQAVADRLGVTPMALYRHVDDKADLLDRVVEALLTEIPLPPADLPWDQRLRALGQAVRAVARRHPHVFPLLLQRPATTPESRRARDAVVASLVVAGLDDEAARRAERLISTVIFGFAASEAGGRFRGHDKEVIDEDFACLEELIASALQRATATSKRPPDPATTKIAPVTRRAGRCGGG